MTIPGEKEERGLQAKEGAMDRQEGR